MSQHSVNVLSEVPLGFWIAVGLLIVVPSCIAVWLYRTFPDTEEGVSADEVDALHQEDGDV